MLGRLRNRFATWRAYRRTVHELRYLDSYALADVGFECGATLRDIKACAKASAREASL